MVPFKRITVIGTFVTKNVPEFADRSIIPNEAIPIVVCYFVPEMAQQCSVRLVHCAALFLTFGIVSFCEIYCDNAVKMSGHYRLVGWRQKVESEPRCILNLC